MNYTKEDQIIPIVEGYREGEFMKVNCPYCGQLHRHGYNVKAYPAHRVAHCHLNKASPGYLVTERVLLCFKNSSVAPGKISGGQNLSRSGFSTMTLPVRRALISLSSTFFPSYSSSVLLSELQSDVPPGI